MPRSFPNRAFTLVELMISMAIALLLILGVNNVFKTTAQTVGAGTSALSAGRDARTVMATLLADLNQVVPAPITAVGGSPGFIIHSEHTYGFRNNTDREGAADPSPVAGVPRPYVDSNLFQYAGFYTATSNPMYTCPVPFVHFRSHRIDKLGFFARGVYQRQTSSDDNSYVSPTAANEAWVVYGHVQQPSNYLINNPSGGSATSWFGPGDLDKSPDKNDNNANASDWILGRQAIALVPNNLLDTNIDPNYLVDQVAAGGGSTTTGLTPLTGPTPTAYATTSVTGKFTLDQCRLDIANTSMAAFGDPNRTGGLYQVYKAAPDWRLLSPPPPNWWDLMLGYRLQASPYLMFSPTGGATTGVPKITSYGMAKASPSVIRGCSQFIVEYAGNYYTKNADGSASLTKHDGSGKYQTSPTPDPAGTLDFYQYKLGLTTATSLAPVVRGLRWYGFPRAVNPNVAGLPDVDPRNGDVVPLRDVLASLSPQDPVTGTYWWVPNPGATPPTNYADAERFSTNWPIVITSGMAPTAFPPAQNLPLQPESKSFNYWNSMVAANDAPTAPGTSSSRYQYTAAWGPDTTMPFPKLIRITIAMDDHEGRLNQPRTFEFIYKVSP
ncbi:MAG TPA: prepilin-type N-terminal cleavage/methylation domain-containing protein [Tepidisphaeraceae bacterium]|nr:prepilin-type N-terminal cleavage/methylation domain-containing protein [Tepidisphaeraceae bacterium]